MLLKDWLEREGITVREFCRKLKIAAPGVYKSIAGTHTLSSQTCLLIEAVTDGMVPREQAMFPQDYVDVDANGKTQYRILPRIHKELAKGIDLKKASDKLKYTDKEFYKWAYGSPKPQGPMAHCHLWAEKHPKLTRVDFMAIGDGLSYMKKEFEKHLKKTA